MKIKNLSIVVVLALTLAVLPGCDLLKELPVGVTLPTEDGSNTAGSPITDAEAVKQLIVANYATAPSSVELEIQNQADNFMRGLVRIGKLPTKSGVFLAYKEGEEWKLAFQGNGPIACGLTQEKGFPVEMTADCFGAGGTGKGYEQYAAITAEDCASKRGRVVKPDLNSACLIGEAPTGSIGDSLCCTPDLK
jgi:hypothetical protein